MPAGKACDMEYMGPHTVMGQRGARNIMSVGAFGSTAVPHKETAGNNYCHSSHCKHQAGLTCELNTHNPTPFRLLGNADSFVGQAGPESPNKTDIFLNSGEMV